jgi:hypothetical protein
VPQRAVSLLFAVLLVVSAVLLVAG